MVQVFSVPIFFIMFREALEASIIISVLLGLVEQITLQRGESHHLDDSRTLASSDLPTTKEITKETSSQDERPTDGLAQLEAVDQPNHSEVQRRLLRKMRVQVFLGAFIGLFIACAIGAAFLAIYYTQLRDLWGNSEDLWEGVFSLIASIMIFVMGLAMLKMDRAKARWRVKLANAFHEKIGKDREVGSGGAATRYALILLPMITVLREGIEAVVFVGGISLGQPATSIPLAAIVGLICGLTVGLVIYFFSARVNVSVFLVISTSFLLLIGAGLFTKSVFYLQNYEFVKLVGADVSEAGDGPGSFRVQGNIWHLPFGNPENRIDGQGWSIFQALFGWSNNGSIGTVLAYIFYWLAVIVALVYMKFKEGRLVLFGHESKAGRARRERREAKQLEANHTLEKQAPGSRIGTPLEESPKELHA